MIAVTYEMKKFFFDRAAIEKKIGAQKAKFLRNVGGYTRTVAVRSLRRAGKKGAPSQPGQPPKWHGKSDSMRKILFGMNPDNSGLVVGPVALGKQFPGVYNQTIPHLHEFGGTVQLDEVLVKGRWITKSRGKKVKPGQKRRRRSVTYKPRPTMAPAGIKAAEKFPGLWDQM